MFEITTQNQHGLLMWAAQEIDNVERFKPDAKAIGQMRNGLIAGVVVFDNFSPYDVNVHVASDGSKRWITKELVYEVFAYPFVQLGLNRITGLVAAKNEAALRFNLHFGLKVEGRCRNALPDDDLIILGMIREECPYIPKEYRYGRR